MTQAQAQAQAQTRKARLAELRRRIDKIHAELKEFASAAHTCDEVARELFAKIESEHALAAEEISALEAESLG